MTKSKLPKVSIIIPLYVVGARFFKDFKKFRNLNYPDYEILVVCDEVLSDKKVEIDGTRARLIITKKQRTGPAEKRDIAIKQARGTICAFIDDDAYPDRDWLRNAVGHFQDPKIAAVGGPGVTPSEDSYGEKLTGLTYSSVFCGGFAQYRFTERPKRFVRDYPAYNLLVKKDVLKSVGGYGSYFYGGEDTFLCLKIVKSGWKILYDPRVRVYHHRRALFMPYLKQIANVGKHRGYFAKKYPETSRTVFYFMPLTLSVGFLLLICLSFFSEAIATIFLILVSIFYLLAVLSVVLKGGLVKALIVGVAIIATHLTYGFSFLQGLLSRKIVR
jgi:GT2 family glycosyltransferase